METGKLNLNNNNTLYGVSMRRGKPAASVAELLVKRTLNLGGNCAIDIFSEKSAIVLHILKLIF